MNRLWFTVLLASLSQLSCAATLSYSTLQGRWQVQSVHVNSDGIQAVVENDPQYMGAEVTFSSDSIIWTKGTKDRPIDPAIDNCSGKTSLTPADHNDPEMGYQVAEGFNVLCGKQPWGPGAVVTSPVRNTMTLYWYDGAILTMKKTG
ncbi:hypothetical protein [Erwinia psidii]|uniref:Lipocalin-like domain-containing protein n=1 Tax=Erwinia psidii TaxID=69224 RepID=A0A3N6UPC7_9GAMM|nr:hypothetical protein [Erwinia psidii]MCX8958883.1 hypothetical protein [Erwinia psidii]MCX8961955.1 hypothetical protein [Erwinia psidii]MCX8966220.1 hypothetical protein [Erwinia psidii]RQM37809.1 hypothetical protein EB241_13205 [Erwinia psidii]